MFSVDVLVNKSAQSPYFFHYEDEYRKWKIFFFNFDGEIHIYINGKCHKDMPIHAQNDRMLSGFNKSVVDRQETDLFR